MSVELKPKRLKGLYELYRREDPWPEWDQSFFAAVQNVASTADEDLLSSAWQTRLWSITDVGTVGQGEHVNVTGAFADAELVGEIVGLRSFSWPREAAARARAIQAAFDRVLTRVRERHAKMRPYAKLGRLFMALLPTQVHAGFSWQSNRDVQKLVLACRGLGNVESAVLVRDRMRAVLGKEGDLEEHVHRATFCWWLHAHFDAILRGEDPAADAGDDETSEDSPAVSGEEMPLEPLPAARLTKGLTAVRGYQDGYRAVVSAAEEGASPEDIVETMQADMGFDDCSPKTCRQVFNRVRRLGFLERRGDLWFPSEKGERLLQEDPPDVLVQELLVRTFGLGIALRILEQGGTATRKEVCAILRKKYPRWTTDFSPNAVVAWASCARSTICSAARPSWR